MVADELRPGASDIKASRRGHHRGALEPSRGAFRGLSAWSEPGQRGHGGRDPLAGGAPHGLPGRGGGFGGGGGPAFSRTLLGVIAYERTFYDAQRQALAARALFAPIPGDAAPAQRQRAGRAHPGGERRAAAFFAAEHRERHPARDQHRARIQLKAHDVGATEGFRPAARSWRCAAGGRVSVDFRARRRDGCRTARPSGCRPTTAPWRTASRAASWKAHAARADARRPCGSALTSAGRAGADFIANVKKAIAAGLPRDTRWRRSRSGGRGRRRSGDSWAASRSQGRRPGRD